MILSKEKIGLKAIAFFESLKGTFALLLALALLRLTPDSLDAAARHWLKHLRMDPDQEEFSSLLHAVDAISPRQIEWILAIAFFYAFFRFVEAYGLWRNRVWAEWVALLSTGGYIPFEFYEVTFHFALWKALLTLGNITVFLFVLWIFISKRAKRNQAA